MDPSECQAAIRQLEEYLASPSSRTDDLASALVHMGGCPRCRRRLTFFAQALALSEDDHLTCAACEAALPWFVSSEEARPGARHRRVSVHLATCPRCAAVFAELRAMDQAAWGGPLTPPQARRPNLAFVRRAPEYVPWTFRPGQLSIELTGLFSPLASTFALPGGVKSAEAGGETRELKVPEAAAPDLQVTVTCQPIPGSAELCTLTVQTDIPSRGGWPYLQGTRVALQRDGEVLEEQETDAFGKVVFEHVAVASLSELAVVVTPVT